MIIRFQRLLFLSLSAICSSAHQLLSYVRTVQATPYQSHSVPPQSFLFVNDSISMPERAVRPFQRSLRDGSSTVDVAVALWIPGGSASALWGRAWEENGTTRALFIYRNSVRILDRGFRLLTYSGTSESNGFRLVWIRVKDADHGTILFSGANMHAAAVFSDDSGSEYLGDANWPKKSMEFVKYNSSEPHTVMNYNGNQYFDEDVYVLTKERCNCQC